MTIRLAQMTGWISFTLMVIYGHLGEVEDGKRTLAPAHRIEDAPDGRHFRLRMVQARVPELVGRPFRARSAPGKMKNAAPGAAFPLSLSAWLRSPGRHICS